MIRISVIKNFEDPKYEGRVFCLENDKGHVIASKGVIVPEPMHVKYGIDKRFADFKIVWATTQKVFLKQDYSLAEREQVAKPTIIHINKNIIQQNAKHGKDEPVCRVEKDGKVRYCMEVQINGPSHMIYSPKKPRPCGAKLWIETYADVELIGEKI